MFAVADGGVDLAVPGKILLLLAGLVALLDVAGRRQLKDWADKNSDRGKAASEASEHLRRVLPMVKQAMKLAQLAGYVVWWEYMNKLGRNSKGWWRRWSIEAQLRPPGLGIRRPSVSPQDIAPLKQDDFKQLLERGHEYVRYKKPDIPSEKISGHLEKHAMEMLGIRLSKDEAAHLTQFHKEFYQNTRLRGRVWIWLHLSYFPAIVLLTFLLSAFDPKPGILLPLFISLLFCTFTLLTVEAGMTMPKVVATWRRAYNCVMSELTLAVDGWMGKDKDGRPIRGFALVLFLAGSVCDLVASFGP